MPATVTATNIPESLKLQAWAKDTWSAGLHQSYFEKFFGTSADSIIQLREELKKEKGDRINIPLLMTLGGDGVTGDNILEGNEEHLVYRDFYVTIDQLRQAVRIEGKMLEKKHALDMRKDAKSQLSLWFARKIDNMIFKALTTAPSKDRVIYAGTAAAEAALTSADKFSTSLIGKAKRKAIEDEDKAIRPIRIDGSDRYVMVIDEYQARDLQSDEKWLDAQKYANIRGEKNPIFTGALGMYDGVIIHSSNRVPRATVDGGTVKTSHALFLGAQAAVLAEGGGLEWNEDTFDYKNQVGFALGRIFGIAKPAFKFDGENLTDFGVINVVTASEDD